MLVLWNIFHRQSYHLWTKPEDQEVEEWNQWGFLRLRTWGLLVPYLHLLCSLGQNRTNGEGGDWERDSCFYGKGDKVVAQKGLWEWEHWLCSSWQRVGITDIVSLPVCVSHFSHVWLCDAMDLARQAPLSMGCPRQKYCRGLPFPPPGDLPDPGMEPGSPALQAGSLLYEPPGKQSLSFRTSWVTTRYCNIGDYFSNHESITYW